MMNDDREVWRLIPEFSDYQASTLGRIRRVTPAKGARPMRLLKPQKDLHGYLCVFLQDEFGDRKRVLIHRLIAATFHGGWPADRMGITAAHWDGDKQNNVARNLRWTTRADNYFDKLRHGRATHGERNGSAKLTDQQVTELRNLRTGGATYGELANRYGVCAEQASRIARRISRPAPAFYQPASVEQYDAARA